MGRCTGRWWAERKRGKGPRRFEQPYKKNARRGNRVRTAKRLIRVRSLIGHWIPNGRISPRFWCDRRLAFFLPSPTRNLSFDFNVMKRWTDSEQHAFLLTWVDKYLDAQAKADFHCFWTALEEGWFKRWSEKEKLFPGSSQRKLTAEEEALTSAAVEKQRIVCFDHRDLRLHVILILHTAPKNVVSEQYRAEPQRAHPEESSSRRCQSIHQKNTRPAPPRDIRQAFLC